MFKNKSGLTKHAHTKHPIHLQSRPSFHQAAPHHHEDVDERSTDGEVESNSSFVPKEGTWADLGPLFRIFHPHLTGL
jgi:hypothetical protein